METGSFKLLLEPTPDHAGLILVSPLADACRALVRREAPLVVTILERKVSGAYAPGATGEIGGYGYKAIGPNAGVRITMEIFPATKIARNCARQGVRFPLPRRLP